MWYCWLWHFMGFFSAVHASCHNIYCENARKNGRLNDITQSAEIMCRLADILYQ